MNRLLNHLAFLALGVVGAFALGYVALTRQEHISALWIIVAAGGIYMAAYRYYSLYLAKSVLGLDGTRMTPAWRHNDGLDYVPTNKYVLFGHHFAAIAGAGPLVGPVLAAQMGYLPGMLWLIAGVVLAGAVQDFMVLFVSTRRDGRSLGDLVKMELGFIPGVIALFGAFMIMVIILAVLALIVVSALAGSSWSTFTVAATIPIAIFMGFYTRYIRPGQIGEMSVIGFILLILAILGGRWIEGTALEAYFRYSPVQLTYMMIGYGFIASVLPVWVLLAPRDYLSTFLKIGTILALAIGVLFVSPQLEMAAVTKYAWVDNGPVWSGSMFPFLFITIACGAVSGFHALISSGTTPKMLDNEVNARFIGYGGMLMESFVAIMALVAAAVIHPGVYFAMNSPAAGLGLDPTTVEAIAKGTITDPAQIQLMLAKAAETVSNWGFLIKPEELAAITADVGEKTIVSRVGGAPTLAVGMAHIMHQAIGGKTMMAFWYHFAILFEALFILTAVDAGTRAGRFMLQDLLGTFVPSLKKTESWVANFIATGLCVAAWGYVLYQAVIDPNGGVKVLWQLFGIANQMLAGTALVLCAVVLFKMKKGRYAWVALVPSTWLLICTLTAGWQKIMHASPSVGFLSMANRYVDAAAQGKVLAPAKSTDQMLALAFNYRLNAVLTIIFMFVVVSIVVFGIKTVLEANRSNKPSVSEMPYEPLPEGAKATS